MSNQKHQLLGWSKSQPADATDRPRLLALDNVRETSLDVLK